MDRESLSMWIFLNNPIGRDMKQKSIEKLRLPALPPRFYFLEPLRSRKDFQALLRQLEQKNQTPKE